MSRGESVYRDPPLFFAPTPKQTPTPERRAQKRKLLEELRKEQALSDDEDTPQAASSSSRGPQTEPAVDKKILGVIPHETVAETSKFARKVLGISWKDKKALIAEARSTVVAAFTGASKAPPTVKTEPTS